LAFAFSLAFAQSFSVNLYIQMYVSMMLILAFIMFELNTKPSIHRKVNRVSIALKLSTLVFLIFATAFIDIAAVNMGPHREPFGIALLLAICSCLAFVLLRVAYALYVRFVGHSKVKNLKVACRKQALLHKIVCLPVQHFTAGLELLTEPDIKILDQTMDVFLAVFFSQQAGQTLDKMRVISADNFETYDPVKVHRDVEASVKQKLLHKALDTNSDLRWKMAQLADALHGPEAEKRPGRRVALPRVFTQIAEQAQSWPPEQSCTTRLRKIR